MLLSTQFERSAMATLTDEWKAGPSIMNVCSVLTWSGMFGIGNRRRTLHVRTGPCCFKAPHGDVGGTPAEVVIHCHSTASGWLHCHS